MSATEAAAGGAATVDGVTIDRVLVSILQKRLKSITEEMSIAMTRTTRSPILCEAKDFVTGLYDAEGNMLEQTENLPILAFSLAPVCKYIIDYYGDDIHPGDVIFHNDVFSMGNQNNDVAVYKPIFFGGHAGGLGGGEGPPGRHRRQRAGRLQPAGYRGVAGDAPHPPGEGVREGQAAPRRVGVHLRQHPPRHRRGGHAGRDRLLRGGRARRAAILERYGLEVFEAHKKYLFDSTERMMRQEIRSIPEGVYTGESNAYYDGKTPGSVYTIRVKVTVEDGHITFDYTGTDAQTPGFVNGTYASSASATILTFLQMVNPDIPHNQGMVRPINIIIPVGTILNAAYPAATTYGNHLCPNNADAIMRALGPVIPERVTAEWDELLCSLTTGKDPRKDGEAFVDINFMGMKGGSGGIYGADGYDHIGMIDASGGVLDQDYEMFEQQTPHLLLKHEYLAGLGRRRPLARRRGRGVGLQGGQAPSTW